MKHKLLKKIIGIFGYKLIEKNFFKNERLISSKSFLKIDKLLEVMFDEKKINNLIQVGANDGKRFDILNFFIKKYKCKSLLVEPIQEYFNQLIENYKDCDFIEFENSAISVDGVIEKIYKVNLIGCLMVLRLAIPCLQKSIAPLIINLSSRLGSIDLRGETQLGGAIAYQCSKAALNMLTKQAAIDLKPLKIRVISQSPGWVKTEMGGVEAKYQVSEAVSMMLHSLNQLPSDKTGIFIGEDGKEIPW